jgi:hypothetical protein
VHRSLRALAIDLEVRASILLDSLPADLATPAGERVSDVRSRLESLVFEARALVSGPLDDAAEAPRNLDSYLAISRQLRFLETYDAPFLTRWSEADSALTAFCWRFLDDIGWTYPRPLITTFSSDYYWVHPRQRVIAVPANEEKRLLATGDLCHELGHIVFAQAEAQVRGDILRVIQQWLRSHAGADPTTLGGRDPAEFLDDVFLSWRGWLQELICDAVATFLAGSAYGWQHIRLAFLDDRFSFMHEPLLYGEHPADEARMRLILATLRELGDHTNAAGLEDHWSGPIALARAPDHAYGIVYPDPVIARLATNVVAGLRGLGLRSYVGVTGEHDLARVGNAAWEKLRSDPDGYPVWERETVTACLEASTG